MAGFVSMTIEVVLGFLDLGRTAEQASFIVGPALG